MSNEVEVERLRFTDNFVKDVDKVLNVNLKMKICSQIWSRTKHDQLGKNNFIIIEDNNVLYDAVIIFAKNGSIIFTKLLDHKDDNIKKIHDAVTSAKGLEGKDKESGLKTYHNFIDNIGLTPEQYKVISNEIKETE